MLSRCVQRAPASAALSAGRASRGWDFGNYGQLTQLPHFDPTPAALTLARAPRVYAWAGLVDDLSGLTSTDDQWVTRDTLPPTLVAILAEAARTYLPEMLANARASMAKSD